MLSKPSAGLVVTILVTALVVFAASALAFRYLGRDWLGPDSGAASQSRPPEFPHMQLQGQYDGPLAGTIIQRWRDPVDGTSCYIYVPMVVHHTPAPSGYVEYGSSTIGSISCVRGPAEAGGGAK